MSNTFKDDLEKVKFEELVKILKSLPEPKPPKRITGGFISGCQCSCK